MKNKLRKCSSNPELFNQVTDILKTDSELSLRKKFNVMKEYHDNLMKVNAYDKEYERLTNRVREDSNELKRFMKLYNKFHNSSKRDIIIHSPISSPFKEIVVEYNKRKMQVPSITERKNIFKLSPLILPNNKISEFYKYSHTKQTVNNTNEEGDEQITVKNRNIDYLEKMNKCIKEHVSPPNRNQIRALQKKSMSMTNMTVKKPKKKRILSFKSPIVNQRDFIKERLRLKNENKTLYNYNKKVENIITSNITDDSKRKGEKNFISVNNYSPTSINSETISTHYNTKDFNNDLNSFSHKKYKREADLINKLADFVNSKRKYSLRNAFSKKDLEGTYNKVKKLDLDLFSRNPMPETISSLPFGGETITRDLTRLKKKTLFFEYFNVPKLRQSYINLNINSNLDKIDALTKINSKIANLEQLYTEKISQV